MIQDSSSVGAIHRFGFAPRNSVQNSPLRVDYQHPMAWTSTYDSQLLLVTVKTPLGNSLYFQASKGSDTAKRTGITQEYDCLVQLLNGDLSPCLDGDPVYLYYVASDGTALRFSRATGKVLSMRTKDRVEVTDKEVEAQIIIERDPLTDAVKQIWNSIDGLLRIHYTSTGVEIAHYAPEKVMRQKWALCSSGRSI